MNKDALFKHVAAMGDKATHGEYQSQPMTDTHREAFEKWADGYGLCIAQISWRPGVYQEWLTETARQSWQAALRYRDEQEKRDGYV